MSSSHSTNHVAIAAEVQDRVMGPTLVVVVIVVVIVHVLLSFGDPRGSQDGRQNYKDSAAGFHCDFQFAFDSRKDGCEMF